MLSLPFSFFNQQAWVENPCHYLMKPVTVWCSPSAAALSSSSSLESRSLYFRASRALTSTYTAALGVDGNLAK